MTATVAWRGEGDITGCNTSPSRDLPRTRPEPSRGQPGATFPRQDRLGTPLQEGLRTLATRPETGRTARAGRLGTALDLGPTRTYVSPCGHLCSLSETRGILCLSLARAPELPSIRLPTTQNPPDSADRGTPQRACPDRKSTRLNSSHVAISYAVFCLK